MKLQNRKTKLSQELKKLEQKAGWRLYDIISDIENPERFATREEQKEYDRITGILIDISIEEGGIVK